MKLVADGGYGAKYPDNTWESYFNSLIFEPDGIGIDIALYGKDIFCYHPKSNVQPFGKDVDTIIEEEIETLLYLSTDELSKFKLQDLAAVLLNKTDFLFLDIKQKSSDIIPKILSSIVKLRLKKNQVVVGARDEGNLKMLAKHKSRYQILSLSEDPDSYKYFMKNGADIIRFWKEDLTPKRLEDVHKLKGLVWANGGSRKTKSKDSTSGETNPSDLQKFQQMGVDGVLVNDISLARSAIERERR